MRLINSLSKKIAAIGTISLLSVSSANAILLYANDFDSAATTDAGVNAVGFTNGTAGTALAGYGNWSGNYHDNRTTGNPATMSTLTLTGLASHTMVDVNFLLGFLESWDSTNGPSCCSPDFVDIYIDGVKVESLTSNNASGSNEYYAGGTELYDDVEINTNYFYDDTLVDMSTAGFLNFAHSASTLTLGIQASGSGWQGSHDEGWGIDNVVINYDGQHVSVPEPATIALLGLGLVGFAASRRNKS